MKAATKVSGIEANHIHPNSRYKEYFVSPPLLNIPITIRVLNGYLRERCSKQFNIPVERMDGDILDKYDTENCVNIILEHIQIKVC